MADDKSGGPYSIDDVDRAVRHEKEKPRLRRIKHWTVVGVAAALLGLGYKNSFNTGMESARMEHKAKNEAVIQYIVDKENSSLGLMDRIRGRGITAEQVRQNPQKYGLNLNQSSARTLVRGLKHMDKTPRIPLRPIDATKSAAGGAAAGAGAGALSYALAMRKWKRRDPLKRGGPGAGGAPGPNRAPGTGRGPVLGETFGASRRRRF